MVGGIRKDKHPVKGNERAGEYSSSSKEQRARDVELVRLHARLFVYVSLSFAPLSVYRGSWRIYCDCHSPAQRHDIVLLLLFTLYNVAAYVVVL